MTFRLWRCLKVILDSALLNSAKSKYHHPLILLCNLWKTLLFALKNFETTTQVSFNNQSSHFDHLDTFPDGEGEGDEDEDEGDEGEDEVDCTPLLLVLLGIFFFSLLALAVH